MGALFNAFLLIPYFGQLCLYLGQIFVFICLLTRGINAAIIASLLASAGLAVKLSDPFIVIPLLIEVLFLHACLRRNFYLLPSVFCYWLLIGLPILLGFRILTSDTSEDVLIITSLTQVANATLCACVAALIYQFIPFGSPLRHYQNKLPKFASIIFALCMLTITLPALILALIFTWQSTHQQEQNIANQLKIDATQLVREIDDITSEQLRTVETLAMTLSYPFEAEQIRNLLIKTAESHPLFSSMLIAKQDGTLSYAAPIEYARLLQSKESHSISTRNYFQYVKNNKTSYVSDVFVGRGFGNDAIFTLSAPILEPEFNGIVQGAMSTNLLQKRLLDNYPAQLPRLFVISDQLGKVIYASPELALPVLSNFDYSVHQHRLIQDINGLNFAGHNYLYTQLVSKYNWTITVLTRPDTVTSVVTYNFYVFAASVLFTLLIFAYITAVLAKRITQPMVTIAEHFAQDDAQQAIPTASLASVELFQVAEHLSAARQLMLHFQQTLSAQVEDKTKQLQALNKQLHHQAQQDSLTKLLNRHAFEEAAQAALSHARRYQFAASLVLIDIDFFKKINDSYGHPFGDTCIRAVADLIKRHCQRETDVVGRYGGEEFILLLTGDTTLLHHELITDLQKAISSLQLGAPEITIQLTVSMGVCSIDGNANSNLNNMIKIADEQLYMSKRKGRNQINFA